VTGLRTQLLANVKRVRLVAAADASPNLVVLGNLLRHLITFLRVKHMTANLVQPLKLIRP